MKILNFGSLNLDYVYSVDHFVQKAKPLFQPDEHFQRRKGLNQSTALGRAGAQVFHAGGIGKGGEFLVEQLKEAGVNTDLVVLDSQCSTGHALSKMMQKEITVSFSMAVLISGSQKNRSTLH